MYLINYRRMLDFEAPNLPLLKIFSVILINVKGHIKMLFNLCTFVFYSKY